jgi:ribosomal protein S18 acetylase RimI-like enzyme
MTTPQGYVVRPPTAGDRLRWQQLYEGYLTFYKTALSDDQMDTVWSWLLSDDHEVYGLVVEGPEGIVGLAHYREFARPSSASVGGFLDDLFVDPSTRGTGVVDALLATLRNIGVTRGWTVIRWITADDNYRARAKYDQQARRTPWVTYDMSPDTLPGFER